MRLITSQLFLCAIAILHVKAAAGQPPVPVPAPESSPGETPQADSTRDPQVVIKIRVVEISLTNMRVLGVDLATLNRHADRPKTEPEEGLSLLECDPEEISGFVDGLTAEDFAKVVAEPTIVTVVGRQASYFDGGEVPTEQADAAQPTYRRIGTEVDITPSLIGKERLRMQVRTKITELDRSLGTETTPGFRVREMNGPVDVDLGKTVVVGGLAQERMIFQKREEGRTVPTRNIVQTLYLFTPQIVEAKAPSPIVR